MGPIDDDLDGQAARAGAAAAAPHEEAKRRVLDADAHATGGRGRIAWQAQRAVIGGASHHERLVALPGSGAPAELPPGSCTLDVPTRGELIVGVVVPR